ncbi:ATP-binding cassette domain-containing protein [Candidatus Dependentiae bacterium]|nr:ATP-binding cassette domain-containing protein [Candidatus Dependentiae bacterium]
MIIIRDAQLQLGEHTIFRELSATFQPHQKVGLVGRNGAGKSTLLKIIAGMQHFTDGSLSLDKQQKIAYMPQELVMQSEKNVFDEAFSVFERYTVLENRMKELEDLLTSQENDDAADAVEEYVSVQEKLAHFDRVNAERKTMEILLGLGFKKEKLELPVSTLSVGWKMRVLLAKLLLQEADFYLFDEPTNHLDIVAKEWFFNFLKNGSFGYLLVTHDRYFLEHCCPQIFELELGRGTLYNGNLTFYLAQKEERRLQAITKRERQDKEISKKEDWAQRWGTKATKAKMAQSMLRQVDRIKEELVEVEPLLPSIHLKFPETAQSGKIVLTVKNVQHSFDNKELFRNVSCEIGRGEKVALIAPNGVGKTTLFELVHEKLPLQNGSIEFGHNAAPAFFEQDQTRILNPKLTVFEEVQESSPTISEQIIRSFLGSFLFSGDDVKKKIGVLSGGERNRVAMVKVLLKRANFLLLDEPTNHLDMYAQDILLQALQQYTGTILMVCHDHDFIQKLATRILELTPTGLNSYNGDYESYLYAKKHMQNNAEQKTIAPAPKKIEEHEPQPQKHENKDLSVLRKHVAQLESKIFKLEQEMKKLTEQFADLQYGSDGYYKAEKKFKETQNELSLRLSEWEQLLKELH